MLLSFIKLFYPRLSFCRASPTNDSNHINIQHKFTVKLMFLYILRRKRLISHRGMSTMSGQDEVDVPRDTLIEEETAMTGVVR